MGWAALTSVGVHASLLGLALLWVWLAARHPVPARIVPVTEPATVQLVMTPPGGKPVPAPTPASTKSDAEPPKLDARPTKTPAPKTTPAKEKAEKLQAKASPPEPRTATAPVAPPPAALDATAPTEPKETADTPAVAAPAAPAAYDDKLTLTLPEAESDTNAWVTGDSILPPTANVKYHNRKPSYPAEAVLHGEQGAVLLLVHVAASGLVTGIEVLKTSGHADLDRSAADAVRTWHFLPSIKDGQPVPADVPARFVFELD